MKFKTLIIGSLMLLSNIASSQCTYELVSQIEGTESYSCTDVTASFTGDAFLSGVPLCGELIFLGNTQTSSITYTFSTPINGFKVNVERLDLNINTLEELQIEVNNSFYPLTAANAGVPGDCDDPAGIFPPGVVRAVTSPGGSMDGITVNAPNITSVKLTLVQVTPIPGAGVAISFFICCGGCATEAGEITPSAPLSFCAPNPASFTAATQTYLESDDLLQYILFTDLTDTLGSIVATSSTPSFAFAPPLQLNITYYGAAMSGNELNGNVDLNDPCLDISNAIEIEWNPTPTVSFSVQNPELCQGGCIEFAVAFTGIAPFGLGYENPFTGSLQNQVFLEETGEILLCSPIAASLGNYILQAVSLTDANCVCD
jgi:hypothetical protein